MDVYDGCRILSLYFGRSAKTQIAGAGNVQTVFGLDVEKLKPRYQQFSQGQDGLRGRGEV